MDTQEVKFLTRAKYRGVTYPADAVVEVLPADVPGLIKAEVIPEDTVPLEPEKEKTIEDMTLPELKKHAKDNGIDLGEATKKEDVLAKIVAAQTGE
jgi:hypothetical protein